MNSSLNLNNQQEKKKTKDRTYHSRKKETNETRHTNLSICGGGGGGYRCVHRRRRGRRSEWRGFNWKLGSCEGSFQNSKLCFIFLVTKRLYQISPYCSQPLLSLRSHRFRHFFRTSFALAVEVLVAYLRGCQGFVGLCDFNRCSDQRMFGFEDQYFYFRIGICLYEFK